MGDNGSDTLYTPLPKENVANVVLTNSSITIRKTFNEPIVADATGGRLTILPADLETGETFLPFDEERYIVVNSDGQTEALTEDKITITSGSRELIIKGLSVLGSATVVATLKKNDIKAQNKIRNRVKTILVDKSSLEGSGVGATTLNDGLTYGNYPYGTRVQDNEICLLEPDVTKIHAIYESSTTGTPQLPRLTLSDVSSFNGSVEDALNGEEIIGSESNCVAVLVNKVTSSTAEVVYVNGKKFNIGEEITFKESSITATISLVVDGDNDITSKYTFNNSTKSTIYDYSRIARKEKLANKKSSTKIKNR